MIKTFKIFAVILSFVALLIALGVVFLPRIVDKDLYLTDIEEWFSNELKRDVRAGDLGFWFAKGPKIVLKDVRITDDPEFSEKPFLKSEKIVISIRILPIFAGRLVMNSIKLVGPEISIIENQEGRLNISSIGSGEYEGRQNNNITPSNLSGLSIPTFGEKKADIEEIELVDAEITYMSNSEGEVPKEAVRFKGMNLEISDFVFSREINLKAGEFKDEIPFCGALTSSVSTGFIYGVPIENLELKGQVRENIFRIEDLKLKLFGGAVKSKGLFDLSTRPYEVVIDTCIKNAMANKLLRIISKNDETCFGMVTFEGTFTGKGETLDEIIKDLSGEGIARIEEGHISSFSMRTELLSLGLIPNKGLSEFLDTSFTIIGGSFIFLGKKFSTSALAVKSPEWDAMAKGEIDLQGLVNFDGDIFLSDNLALEIKSEYIPSLIDSPTGRIAIPFHITGSIENPEFILRPEFLTEKNAEEIFEEFKEKLNEKYKEGFTIKFIKNNSL